MSVSRMGHTKTIGTVIEEMNMQTEELRTR